jgi:chromosome segregation ATPase
MMYDKDVKIAKKRQKILSLKEQVSHMSGKVERKRNRMAHMTRTLRETEHEKDKALHTVFRKREKIGTLKNMLYTGGSFIEMG